jgi:serine/threonine protein kinase
MGSGDDAAKSPAPALAPERPASVPPRRGDRASVRPGGPESLLGKMLSGRYRIERVIGEGGMGAVYAAEHTLMRKRLAVKVLHPEMSRMPEVVARFEREAMAAAHIDHPNVAAATDFGKLEDGSFFLVLEFVEGKSLRDLLSQGRLDLGRALHITQQIASALGRAHALGIVHRDLKPENVMLVERGNDKDFVKVLDFGIAKVPVGDLAASPVKVDPHQPVLTQLGMVYGTPEYMAPEQALGQEIDSRADLYALGVMTYEMLTGLRPFDHDSKVTLLGMHVTAPVPPMASKAPGVNVPKEIEAVVGKLLAKDASHRYADAKEMLEAIGAALTVLVAEGRVDAASIESALGGGSAPLGMFGPASMRGSRASLPSGSAFSPRLSQGSGEHVAVTPMGARLKTLSVQAAAAVRSSAARVPGRAWAIGGAAIGVAVFAVLFVTVLTGGRLTTTDASEADAAALAVTSKPPDKPPPDTALDDAIGAAELTLQKGDVHGAVAQLVPLETQHPERPDIHRTLERAYAASRDVPDALREAELWLKIDPSSASDTRLGEDVHAAALGKDDPDGAFALLQGYMAASGADILYEIGYGATRPTAAGAKARLALATSDVRAHASPSLAVTLELRSTPGCEGKHTLLSRARDEGDARTLALLKTYAPTSGCGFLATRDCWPCLHRDGSLGIALKTIEDRLAARSAP